ncbi:hypothetical protein K2173_019054 [Erythroxylum novogranatense]|uniref:Uncharacterized protein n=1 Tax=Erythroxylum novogranatense TaxID=1862640 RepID=A0AAV8SSI8_9ROSI|nr:hypothetical protein K2173_019054 [Erythroxylum novogranatense]
MFLHFLSPNATFSFCDTQFRVSLVRIGLRHVHDCAELDETVEPKVNKQANWMRLWNLKSINMPLKL